MERTGTTTLCVAIPLQGGGVRNVELDVPCSYDHSGKELLDGHSLRMVDLFKAAHMLADAAKKLAAVAQFCPVDAIGTPCPSSARVNKAALAMSDVLTKVDKVLSKP